MRFSIFLYLFAFCMITYSQDRICFIDSLEFCKKEIRKLERYNLRKLRRNPAYWKYSNLKQLHFFFLKNKTNCPITKEEYLDYSFLKKLKFSRSRTWFWGKLLNADTFLFTPEGKLVGKICFGFVEPLGWLKIFNIDELGRLVAENKISFAFNGGNREDLYTHEAFNHGIGDMYCVVIDGKIFLLDNLYFNAESPDGRKLHLLSLEEFIDKHK